MLLGALADAFLLVPIPPPGSGEGQLALGGNQISGERSVLFG
jgi:hypothetical protein